MNPSLLEENSRRLASLSESYDPQRGIGCLGSRVELDGIWLPVALLHDHPDYVTLTGIEQERLRCKYDFEFWCLRCVKISDKRSGRLVDFVLNRPQRRLLSVMERQRLDGNPIRVILLKARQWGGSTLVQTYIAWHQIVLFEHRNSIIVGHKRNSGFAIKNMMRTLLANYPPEMVDDGDEYTLQNVRDSVDVQELKGRDCFICLSSSFSPDAGRGFNFNYAHLSEVAYWNNNRSVDPNDLVRTVTGSVLLAPNTIIVMESTANGVNSFFYKEWMRALGGQSIYEPVFVPWHEIDLYSRCLDDGFSFDSLSDYELSLWSNGLTLEQIYWYHEKRKEFSDHQLMMAEFPGTDKEAFENSVKFVFSSAEQKAIVEPGVEPTSYDSDGVAVWQPVTRRKIVQDGGTYVDKFTTIKMPPIHRYGLNSHYLAVLSIGSETSVTRPSVLSVWDVSDISYPTLSCQWSGNLDLGSLSAFTLRLCRHYDNAFLVVVNYDLHSRDKDRQQGVFVSNELFERYENLYIDKQRDCYFELNRSTYALIFHELIFQSRHGSYLDRDKAASRAVSRMIISPNGRYYSELPQDHVYLVNRGVLLYLLRELTTQKG